MAWDEGAACWTWPEKMERGASEPRARLRDLGQDLSKSWFVLRWGPPEPQQPQKKTLSVGGITHASLSRWCHSGTGWQVLWPSRPCHCLGGEARFPGEPKPKGKIFRNRGILVTPKPGHLGAVSVLWSTSFSWPFSSAGLAALDPRQWYSRACGWK